MPLHLHSFQPDLGRLMRLAARERLLPPGDDAGYAVHAVLAASFGALAPKPWVLLPPGEGGGRAGRILAYGDAPLQALLEHAAMFADPAFSAPLVLERAESRVMPVQFARGARLGFRVRVRPVIRIGKPLAGHPRAAEREGRSRERDAYLGRVAAVERAAATASAGGRNVTRGESLPDDAVAPGRAACYLEWLDARLRDAGASIARAPREPVPSLALGARVEAFRLTRLMARDRSGGGSRSRHPEGPDVAISGTLVVDDPDRFAAGLARGIGRFRAFGFGMLLLAPPRC